MYIHTYIHKFLSFLQLSTQLFDSRAHFHKISCQYALELINLHKKKRPELIEILVHVVTVHHVIQLTVILPLAKFNDVQLFIFPSGSCDPERCGATGH